MAEVAAEAVAISEVAPGAGAEAEAAEEVLAPEEEEGAEGSAREVAGEAEVDGEALAPAGEVEAAGEEVVVASEEAVGEDSGTGAMGIQTLSARVPPSTPHLMMSKLCQ